MAPTITRFALAAADIPMISTQQPRSVISGQTDSAGKLPRQFYGSDASYDFNTLQVLYAENVMPSAAGWTSVSYQDAVESPTDNPAPGAPTPPVSGFYDLQALRRSDPNDLESDPHDAGDILPTNSSTVFCEVNRIANDVQLWRRFPVSFTQPEVQWDILKYYDNNAALHNFAFNTLGPQQNVTFAYPSGFQFICVPGSGLFFVGTIIKPGTVTTPHELDYIGVRQYCATGAPVVVASLLDFQFIKNFPGSDLDVVAIAASNGYLIAGYQNIVAWAPANGNVFDFETVANGVATGSDSRIPEELIGNVTALVSVTGGFIIFSEYNAVSAIYSPTNYQNPWTFREISGCGGIKSERNITQSAVNNAIFAVTSVGLQRITINSAQDVEPAVSNFIEGRQLELYDYTNKVYNLFNVQGDLTTSCTLIGSRFLCVSIGLSGAGSYDIVVVLDLSLKRWGKLRIVHTAICDLFDVEVSQDLLMSDLGDTLMSTIGETVMSALVTDVSGQYTGAMQQIGVLLGDGTIRQAILAPGTEGDETQAFMEFGQLQLSRNKMVELHALELEGSKGVTMNLKPSYDGRNLQPAVDADNWVMVENTGDYQKYAGIVIGQNFNFEIVGKFDLTTIISQSYAAEVI